MECERWRAQTHHGRDTAAYFNASPIKLRIARLGKMAVRVLTGTAAEDLDSWDNPLQ
jgi:hypothetical protein